MKISAGNADPIFKKNYYTWIFGSKAFRCWQRSKSQIFSLGFTVPDLVIVSSLLLLSSLELIDTKVYEP